MVQPSQTEVALYRAALRDVNALAQAELLSFWRQFDIEDVVDVRDGLMDVLPGVIGTYQLSAATLAADWYDIQRYKLGATGRFRAILAEPPTDARAGIMARWAVGPMFGDSVDGAADLVLSKISGGLQRVVADGARDTIVGSVSRDPGRVGWARVTSGGCDFCEMLASRGAVYSEDTAFFASHDHCQCDAVLDVA